MSRLLQDGCDRLGEGTSCKTESRGSAEAAISLTHTPSNSMTAEVMRPPKRGRRGLWDVQHQPLDTAAGAGERCLSSVAFIWVRVCYLLSILLMLHYTYNILYIIMQCPLSLCRWSTRKEVTFLPNNIIPGCRIYSVGSLCESLSLPDASCVDKMFFVHLNQVLQLRWWKVSHLYKYMAF